jgi:hypothetical protein
MLPTQFYFSFVLLSPETKDSGWGCHDCGESAIALFHLGRTFEEDPNDHPEQYGVCGNPFCAANLVGNASSFLDKAE